jgi:hypothetical protein
MNIAGEATADRNSCVKRELTIAHLKQLSDEELVAYHLKRLTFGTKNS